MKHFLKKFALIKTIRKSNLRLRSHWLVCSVTLYGYHRIDFSKLDKNAILAQVFTKADAFLVIGFVYGVRKTIEINRHELWKSL